MVRRPRRRLTLSLLTAAVALLASCLNVTPAYARSCLGTLSGHQACQERWMHAAVFVGRVIRIDPATRQMDLGSGRPFTVSERRVHLAVTEGFAGVPADEADVFTGGSDGYAFEPGGLYLIYADKRPDGSLETSTCSPTKRIEAAAADLAYLRAIPAVAPRDGRIIGLALGAGVIGVPYSQLPPYAGARIIAEGQGLRRSATSGADGRYEIRVPAGSYRVHAEVDAGMYTTWASLGRPGETELKNTRACAVADFAVHFDGHVSGRVTSSSGQAVPHVAVELVSVGPDPRPSTVDGRTDSAGRLDLEHVAPGRYTLAFHTEPILGPPFVFAPIFFPGTSDQRAARLIDVAPSAKVAIGDFVVPDSVRFVTLTGVVTDPAGHPIAGARVYLEADSSELLLGPAVVTGADGRFAMAVVDGARYKVVAESVFVRGQLAGAEIKGVIASADMTPIVLTPIVR